MSNHHVTWKISKCVLFLDRFLIKLHMCAWKVDHTWVKCVCGCGRVLLKCIQQSPSWPRYDYPTWSTNTLTNFDRILHRASTASISSTFHLGSCGHYTATSTNHIHGNFLHTSFHLDLLILTSTSQRYRHWISLRQVSDMYTRIFLHSTFQLVS